MSIPHMVNGQGQLQCATSLEAPGAMVQIVDTIGTSLCIHKHSFSV